MEDTFSSGEVLYYWYDQWIAAAALAVITVLTIGVLVRTSWFHIFPIVIKTITVASTVIVSVVVLDRIGGNANFSNPEAFGYTSIGAAGVTFLLGIITLIATRGGAPLTMGTITGTFGITGMTGQTETPEAGTDVTELLGAEDATDATQALVGSGSGDSQTLIMGGAGATAQVSASQAAPKLSVRKGPEAGKVIELTQDSMTIGRSSSNDVVLSDATVSRQHATVTREGQNWVIEDGGSSSGTLINGSKVTREVLQSGSVLTIGETELVFEHAGSTAMTQAAASGATGATAVSQRTAAASQPTAADAGATIVQKPGGSNAWFIAKKGSQAGQSFDISGELIHVGRSARSNVRLEDESVSREHAAIFSKDGKYVLRDVGSAGGTQVNGKALGGLPLKEGGTIKVGASELVFTTVEASANAGASDSGATVVMRKESRGVLLVRSGPAAGTSINVGADDVVIGRDPGTTGAKVNDPEVSRRHAVIRKSGDGFTVFDLGSANGTFVDGVAVSGHELQNGDTVTLGNAELQFVRAENS